MATRIGRRTTGSAHLAFEYPLLEMAIHPVLAIGEGVDGFGPQSIRPATAAGGRPSLAVAFLDLTRWHLC